MLTLLVRRLRPPPPFRFAVLASLVLLIALIGGKEHSRVDIDLWVATECGAM